MITGAGNAVKGKPYLSISKMKSQYKNFMISTPTRRSFKRWRDIRRRRMGLKRKQSIFVFLR
jgi:hypothetical protein